MVRHYALLPRDDHTLDQALQLRAGGRLEALRTLERRARVLFVGTDYDQDASGLIRGLESVADVVVFTQPDGHYGQCTASGDLSFDMAGPNGRRLLHLLESARTQGVGFDVVLGQMWDGYIDGSCLSAAQDQFGAVVVNIAMDDRHTFEVRKLGRVIGTRGLTACIDLAATAAPEAVDWYRKENCPAVFFPEASDPTLFYPEPSLRKRYDVAFVGACYGIRERLVKLLARAGIDVVARGNGWEGGRIAATEVPRLFAESKVVLGVGTIGHSTRLKALKLRDFDAPMSGSCYLTQRNSDLELLYRIGEEIAVYNGEDDLVATVEVLLQDDARREEIARRGRIRAENDHTWAQRFSMLFALLLGSGPVAPRLPIGESG